MENKVGSYRVIDLPPARRDVPNFIDVFWWKHCMYGLLEVDVTIAKQFIEEYKAQTGELLSFTGYLVYCVAQAVGEDTRVQAYLKGRKQLVVFDDVHVAMTLERDMGGSRGVMGHTVRNANRKTFLEIHHEIRSAQSKAVPPNKGIPGWFRAPMTMPWPVPRLAGAAIRAWTSSRPRPGSQPWQARSGSPQWGCSAKDRVAGACCPCRAPYLVVGSTAWKPAVVDGRIEPREILNLTLVFDHDVIDGAPAARFARRLIELIESGYGLDALPVPFMAGEPATAEPAAVR